MILPRTKQDLLEHPLVTLQRDSKEFIGRYLEEFIEEINFFIRQNNLDWVIKERGGKAYIMADAVPIPKKESLPYEDEEEKS